MVEEVLGQRGVLNCLWHSGQFVHAYIVHYPVKRYVLYSLPRMTADTSKPDRLCKSDLLSVSFHQTEHLKVFCSVICCCII